MTQLTSILHRIDRCTFLRGSGVGLGSMALAKLEGVEQVTRQRSHHAPPAKRVIYLFQSGGPSQVDLFDYKPALAKFHGQDIFKLVEKSGRLTGCTNQHEIHPVINTRYRFFQHGENSA